MKENRLLILFIFFLIAQGLLSACYPSIVQEGSVSDTIIPTTKEAVIKAKCGDGVCDQAEQGDPDLCPQDCQEMPSPTSESPTPTVLPTEPAVQEIVSTPSGKCGDGVCDEMEQKNPNLCPSDCPDTQGSSQISATGLPDYEPPINIFLILHIDPIGELGMTTFKPEPAMYKRTYEEIDWLLEEADRHNLDFTSLYNGWYTKWALDMGDLSQFEKLIAAGHEIGTHTHQITYDTTTDTWITHNEALSIYGRPNYNPELARQCWQDGTDYVNQILNSIPGDSQNQIMCSTALTFSDEKNMMAEFGFKIAAGNRLEAGVNYLGHMPWNPWRASTSDEPGYEIAEDLRAAYVSINHATQIGGSEAHDTAATVSQLQRQFIQLYIEWLARERKGAEDRIWSFGFVYHPNHGDRYNNELSEFLEWLDENFIGQDSPYGNTIAQYATVSSIIEDFYAWEQTHPDISSFNFVRGEPYPYTYDVFSEKLRGADYDSHLELGKGLWGIRFTKDDQVLYILWSEQGEQMVDFSAELDGQVQVIDATGQEFMKQADSLLLNEDPIIIETSP